MKAIGAALTVPIIDLRQSVPRENLMLQFCDDNTLRDRSCSLCHGLDYTDPAWSDVLGVHHNSHMLKRIAALPNAMVCRSASREDAILFRAEGFQGISLGWSDDR